MVLEENYKNISMTLRQMKFSWIENNVDNLDDIKMKNFYS